jgi:hypothetical protein
MFNQEPSDLIDHRRSLANQATADPVQSLEVELLAAFQRHETHRRTSDGLSDRLGVAVIVLGSFDEWLDVLCGNQSNVVAERGELPP